MSYYFLKALELQDKERVLLDSFRAIVAGYFEEYTDAAELDPEFAVALETVWDTIFPMGNPGCSTRCPEGCDFGSIANGE